VDKHDHNPCCIGLAIIECRGQIESFAMISIERQMKLPARGNAVVENLRIVTAALFRRNVNAMPGTTSFLSIVRLLLKVIRRSNPPGILEYAGHPFKHLRHLMNLSFPSVV
jgi:hypothetical protein